MAKTTVRETAQFARGASWERLGAFAAVIMLVYCLATMVQIPLLGGAPQTALEAFRILQQNRIVGLLRLDLPTMFAMPFYYLLLLSLWRVLKPTADVRATLGAALGFAGNTLILATPTALPLLLLSNRYAAASTNEMRVQLLSAGDAVLASDIWHGTGALIGGVLLQTGLLLMCTAMLRSPVFGKITASVGILAFGLDLAHIFATPLSSSAGVILMATAGPLYPVWFFLVARKLLQSIRRQEQGLVEQVSSQSS